ncbi:MAG: hypothetical protein PVI92_02700 [Chromatiales bacterium]|jgi:chromosome segregation ATPase
MDRINLGGIENPQQLQLQNSSQSKNPLIVLSPRQISLSKQPNNCLVRYDEADDVRVKGALLLTAHNLEAYAQNQQPYIIDQSIKELQFSDYRLPHPHIINTMQIGQLATVACLLTQQDMEVIVMELGRAELSALIALGKMQPQHLHKNLYMFDQHARESSAMSLQELDAQQREIVKLKRKLYKVQQQFDTERRQRDVEKMLLTRALSAAKNRHKREIQQNRNSVTIEQRSSTLGGHLREEIAAMGLQLVKPQASGHVSQLPSQQTHSELEQYQHRLTKQLEESEASRQQLEDEISRLSKERFDLESSLHELRGLLNGKESSDQTQISSLQQSLNEARETLDQAKAAHQKQVQELQAELEKASQPRDESQTRYEALNAELQQQIQTQESFHGQLVQEKAELANSLNAETQRALEFAQQIQSLDEHKRNLEHELETMQQAFSEASAQHENDMALLSDELDQARLNLDELGQSRQQLDESLQQSHAELQAQQERERELRAALDETKNNAERTTQELHGELEQLRQSQSILQQTLEESGAQLALRQSELEQKESSLLSALKEAKHTANEHLARYKAKIEDLQQQIQIQELSNQQLTQEKAELASCLQAESNRSLEFAGQAETQDEHRQNLEHELETLQQAFSKVEAQHQNDLALLKQEKEQLSQALEAQKQHDSNTKARLNKLINSLKSRLESTRAKAIRQRQKRIRLAAMLAKEQKTSEHLKQLTEAAEEKAKAASNRLAEVERNQQEMQAEVQKEIEAAQEAWGKASESDIALQAAKMEYASRKDELEQEIDNLRAQLEHQEENLETIQSEYAEEKAQLHESLNESQTELKVAQTNIRTLKRDRQAIREAKLEVDEQVTRLKAEFRKERAELTSELQSSQQEVASLRKELADVNRVLENPEEVEHLRQQLRQAQDDKTALKQQIDGLREVQLEMESQRGEAGDAELTKLRRALFAAEVKLEAADKLAQQVDTLQRERHVQEIAIETLSEDLDALTEEKAALIDERDRLQRALSDIQEQSIGDA